MDKKIKVARELVKLAKELAAGYLIPSTSQKSFGGKAIVFNDGDNMVLFSYGTPVMMKDSSGKCHRLWDGWTATTGKHIKEFSGVGKAQWDVMPVEESNYDTINILSENAYAVKGDDGSQTLYSYDTPVLKRDSSGKYHRLWDGWTATTGKHIKQWSGIDKARWDAMPVEE